MGNIISTTLAAIHRCQERIEEMEHERLLLVINHRIMRGEKKGRLVSAKRWYRWTYDGKVEIWRDEPRTKEFYFSCSYKYLMDLEEKYNA